MRKISVLLATFFLTFSLYAQTDSLRVNPQTQNTVAEQPVSKKKQKRDRKRRDEFKLHAGLSLNQMSISSDVYKSEINLGYQFGASYKRGRFFYWELGARYNNPVYDLVDATIPADFSDKMDGSFGIRNIDVPISFGINILSITSRIVGLRVFVSAVPTFALGVGSNDLGITKDNINSFVMFGQGGVGVDVAFLYLEAGLNYGFTDVFTEDIQSKPYQVFLNLGFRF